MPIGLVTGTNGKTTTVRLATHIMRTAEQNVGLSSTDWIAVNDKILDRGDWSGPGGARAVLREQSLMLPFWNRHAVACCAVASASMLADVALITNIAEDHLGDFGSQNLAELMDIKWIVSRAVVGYGKLILNADDRLLVSKADRYPGEIIWFSLQADNPTGASSTLPRAVLLSYSTSRTWSCWQAIRVM